MSVAPSGIIVDTSMRRILVSVRLFTPSSTLLALMRVAQTQQGAADVTSTYDAYLLDPGLGPPTYLTADGRIVWDDDDWGVAGTRAEALRAIITGAKKTGVHELRELLPTRDSSASDCDDCGASGWFDARGALRDVEGGPFCFVCPQCAGLCWTSPSVVLTESVIASPTE